MIKLSILTPSVPSRLKQLAELERKSSWQAAQYCAWNRYFDPLVEHLILTDNKQRRVGAKRQDLINLARGEYVAFVDDDDDISDHYVAKILEAIERAPDVVTFQQGCTVGTESVVHKGTVHFDLNHRIDEPFQPGGITKRRPWHICAWRRSLATQCVFPEINYGEDRIWVDQIVPLAKTQVHIPEILHYYRHSPTTTEAPPPTI
jgi:hypothetical protein